jgi:Na+-transporting methylmalonyl-CoA/oxaloacetate decarboxylase gamma subunit
MRQIILLFLIFVFSFSSNFVSAAFDPELTQAEIRTTVLNVQRESTLSPTIKNGVASQ